MLPNPSREFTRPIPRVARATPGYIAAIRGLSLPDAKKVPVIVLKRTVRPLKGPVFPWPYFPPPAPAPVYRRPPPIAAPHEKAAEILEAVIAVWPGATRETIRGRRRSTVIVRPRQMAMALTAQLCQGMSLPAIGRYYNRDHTTVIGARKAHARLMVVDQDYAGRASEVMRMLNMEARDE